MKDPFVEEVRRQRMAHTRRFNSDLHAICEDLRRFESSLGGRVGVSSRGGSSQPRVQGQRGRAKPRAVGRADCVGSQKKPG
jgi:hypothetical protein